MLVNFTKMHGLGNDFVVIDAINQTLELAPEKIRALADRHFGIGFDQLLLVESPSLDNPYRHEADFHYRIFNADGGEVEQCGNGARCFASFVREEGLSDKRVIPVSTHSGLITLHIEHDDQVTVNMGQPVFTASALPFLGHETETPYRLQLNDETIEFYIASMGNPHAVIQVNELDSLDIESIAIPLQSHASFPQSVNVGFMQILDRDHIRLRVYERGAGETLACGTGACAAVACGIKAGLLDERVTVAVTGGILSIYWSAPANPVMMTGSTQTVFKGTFEI